MDPRTNVPVVPVVPATVAPGAFVDPRPPLTVEKEKVHDFEVHREGGYAKGKTFPNKAVASARTDDIAIGAQPHTFPPTVGAAPAPLDAATVPPGVAAVPAAYVIDPRPPLRVEKERVHDFEAHREGGHVKGHTFAGAKPEGAGLVNLPGGPAGTAQPGPKV